MMNRPQRTQQIKFKCEKKEFDLEATRTAKDKTKQKINKYLFELELVPIASLLHSWSFQLIETDITASVLLLFCILAFFFHSPKKVDNFQDRGSTNLLIKLRIKYIFAPCTLRPLFFVSSVLLFIKFGTCGI